MLHFCVRVGSGVSPSCLKLHMKVDAWKTNTTKDGRATPKGRASIRSMISRTTTSSATKVRTDRQTPCVGVVLPGGDKVRVFGVQQVVVVVF